MIRRELLSPITPLSEDRERRRRTIADQVFDVYSSGAYGREGDRLRISCAGWTATGRNGGTGAGREICCQRW